MNLIKNLLAKSTGLLKAFLPPPVLAGALALASFVYSAPTLGFDFSNTFATDEWLMQEPSGSYVNNKGGTVLTVAGGLQGQAAMGIRTGSSYTGQKAYEIASSTDMAECLTNTVLDSDNEDLCYVQVFRATLPPSATRALASKRDGLNAGWVIQLSSAGKLNPAIEDTLGNIAFNTLSSNVCDGAWHWLKFFYDVSAAEYKVKTDLDAEVVISTAALIASVTNTSTFRVGDPVSGSAHTIVQTVYSGGAVGSDAQAMYDEDIVLPGKDPAIGNAAKTPLTTINRNSLVSHEVEAGAVCHFAGATTPALGCQLPITFNAAFTDSDKLGLYTNSSEVNEIAFSERISAAWTHTNASSAAAVADSPDGFRSADSVTANINNGLVRRDFDTTLASTLYTGSYWIKRNGASNVSGILRLADAFNATQSDFAFTATSVWQRIQVSHTMGGAGAVGRLSAIISSSGESILIWGAQADLGEGAGAYIRTNGAAAALVASDYSATGNLLNIPAGEIQLTTAFTKVLPVNAFLYGSAGTADERFTFHTGAGNITFRVLNSAGGTEDQVNSTGAAFVADTEFVIKQLWDSVDGVDAGAFKHVIFQNGLRINGDAFPWAGSASPGFSSEVFLGQRFNATGTYNGHIQKMEIFAAPVTL